MLWGYEGANGSQQSHDLLDRSITPTLVSFYTPLPKVKHH